MPTEAVIKLLRSHLFADPDANVFAVLDGASVPDLLDQLYGDEPPEHCCLFPGTLEPDMAEVAPYLAQLEPDAEFTQWVLSNGWGKHWGIFGVSNDDLGTLRWHFRTLVSAHGPDLEPLTFRFYDPRVFRVFIPTCRPNEIASIFGPVLGYLLEDDDPNVLLRVRSGRDAANFERLPLRAGRSS